MKILGIGPVLEVLQRLIPAKENGHPVSAMPIKQYHTLLLPLLSAKDTERLVEMATHFPQVHKIIVCYIISVPRALTLEGALPEEEETAGIVLAEMAKQLRESGFDVQTQVRRARTPVDEALKVIHETDTDLVMLSRDDPDDLEETAPSTRFFADSLSEKAPCEVLLLHSPL
jgi:nucleotide-binding universal stress UspA family protein